MAELRALAAQFDAVSRDSVQVIRAEMAKAARPFAPAVRASILNIPTHGSKHTGLRLRIARCVQTWAEINGPQISVGVEVNGSRMPSGQMALPLYMEGAKAPWRHPVYGDRAVWVSQEAHPYFWRAVQLYGPASLRAVSRAVQLMSDQIAK
jgi:hypothetical protein